MPRQTRNNVVEFRPRTAGVLKPAQGEIFSQNELDDYVSFQTMKAIADKELDRMYKVFCRRLESGAVNTHASLQFDAICGFTPIDSAAAI